MDASVPRRWKNPINRVLNLALYLVLCFLIGTGYIMWIRLPPGSRLRARGEEHEHGARVVAGLSRHEWGDWHLWAAIAFVVICVLHVAMNWAWMMKIAASRHAWRVWIGLGAGGAMIVALAVWPA